jgi:hypothetical protein
MNLKTKTINMDSNLKLILAEFEKLKGQFVITQSDVVERLIAIGSDDMDYYYVTYNGRKTIWNTCVGAIIPLKGKIDDKHYNEFIRVAKLNHFDQVTIFGRNPDDVTEDKVTTFKMAAQKHKAEIEHIESPDKYLSEVCWDLN